MGFTARRVCEDCDQNETRGLRFEVVAPPEWREHFFLNQTCPENSRPACSQIGKHAFCVAVVMGKEGDCGSLSSVELKLRY